MTFRKLERHVFVCVNRRPDNAEQPDCARRGGEEVRAEFKRLLGEAGLKGRVRANAAGCLDRCQGGVTVVVYPEQTWYGGVTPEDVPEIVERHLVGGDTVTRLLSG